MLQYNILLVVLFVIVIVLLISNCIAYFRKKASKSRINFSIEEIQEKYFIDIDRNEFQKTWPGFCDLINVPDAYNILDKKTPALEKYFPFSDILYENLETFLNQESGDVSQLTVRQLFYLFYAKNTNEIGEN